MRGPRTAVVVVLALITGMLAFLPVSAAHAVQAVQPTLVSATAQTNTPDVNDGVVYSIGQVNANDVVLGGSFTSVSPHGDAGTTYSRPNIVAFDPTSGVVSQTFTPAVNGEVDTIIPGPAANEVYIGGSFTTVNGVSSRVALLDATTGATISTWKPAGFNDAVTKLVLNNGVLYVGGIFTTVGGASHPGMVSLNPTTGKLTSTINLAFTGHHNYGVNCTPGRSCADGNVGVKSFDVTPDGTHMIVIGNFTSAGTVGGTALPRDQVAFVDLSPSGATVDPNWSTQAYTAACASNAFDSYIRDVQFSPDGSYFVIVATGASGTNKDGSKSSCDSAARYETTVMGANVRPTWIDYTGRDSYWSVAVTGTAVYAGGHERWANNSFGSDNAGAGAVPRPGVVAFSPVSGLPLSWNPGRNPRGAGAYSLLATQTGLWVGSDTDYIGNMQFLHKKIAFFPLAGGETMPAEQTGSLPGRVYTAGGLSTSNQDQFSYRHFDGTTVGAEQTLNTGISWSAIRGAFMVDGELIYGKADGNLYERSYDGSTLGSEVLLDPYDDPFWDNVQTGSGQTYQGKPTTMSTEMPSVTSMFFTNGRLYYTLSNSTSMHWRWFEPEDGVIGADEFTVVDGRNWSNVAGAFLSGNTLYYADKTSGALNSIAWNGTQSTGSSTIVDTSQNWASRGMFILADATHANQPPVANFIATCSATSTACTFDPSASNDPDGAIADFSWTFGDNTGEHHPNNAVFSHNFPAAGKYAVTLTVTDNDGATGTLTKTINAGQSTPIPTFGGASSSCSSGAVACKNSTQTTVGVPSGTVAGDALLLFVSRGTTGTTDTIPSGWNLLGSDPNSPLQTDVYYRAATAGDVGATVSVGFSAATKNAVTLADYHGADPNTIEAVADSADSSTANHITPNASVSIDGSLPVSYWADRSTTTVAWTPPASVTARATQYDTGGSYVTSMLADAGATVHPGSYGGLTATTNAAGSKGTAFTIILAPAGTTASPPTDPTAAFTSACNQLDCTFDGSSSAATTDGATISNYTWDFGDGNSQAASPSPHAEHVYASPGGSFPVKLTVTDSNGMTDSVTQNVTPSIPTQNISFVGANAYDGNAATASTTVPAAATAGDTLLLFQSFSSSSITGTPPPGWTLVNNTSTVGTLNSTVYEKTATASDPGSSVSIPYSGNVKSQLTVAAYRNVSASNPIETSAASTASSTATHTAPALNSLTPGTWVVSFWTDKATTTSAWTPPASESKRSDVYGSASGAVSSLVADSAGPITGTYAAQTATTNATSGSAAQWSVALTAAS